MIGIGCAGWAALALARLLVEYHDDLASAFRIAPFPTGTLITGPVVAAWLAALVAGAGRRVGAAASEERADVTPPGRASVPGEDGLRLLGVLQRGGRFVDFLEADLRRYTDEEIGSAMRSVHAGCRSALEGRLRLSPVLPGVEGEVVTVEPGFDPGAVHFTGQIRGEGPHRGMLRHAGWRASALKLPDRAKGDDPSLLAPAEIEVT